MFLDDYGELVRVEICNIMWQKEEDARFEGLHEAWTYVQDKLDNSFIKFHIKRNKEGSRRLTLKFFKVPESGNFIIYQATGGTVEVDDLNKIYDMLGDLILDNEGGE